MSDEEQYKQYYLKAFGKLPQNIDANLSVRLSINGSSQGNIEIIEGSVYPNIRFHAKTLLAASKGILVDTAYQKVAALEKNGLIWAKDLTALSVKINRNPADLSLRVIYPPDMVEIVTISADSRWVSNTRYLNPAPLTGYLNYSGTRTDTAGLVDSSLGLEGAISLYSVSMTYQGRINDTDSEIRSLALTQDINHQFRYQLGRVPAHSQQVLTSTAYDLIGASFGTLNVDPREWYQDKQLSKLLAVDEEGNLSIRRNGHEVFKTDITPGRYQITNIPTVDGPNTIQFFLNGQEIQEASFEFTNNRYVLGPGKHLFTYQAGLPANTQRLSVEDTDALLWRFDHHVGINRSTELSMGVDRNLNHELYRLGTRSTFLNQDINMNLYRGDRGINGYGGLLSTRSLGDIYTQSYMFTELAYESPDINLSPFHSQTDSFYSASAGLAWNQGNALLNFRGLYGFKKVDSGNAYGVNMELILPFTPVFSHRFSTALLSDFDEDNAIQHQFNYGLLFRENRTLFEVFMRVDLDRSGDSDLNLGLNLNWNDVPTTVRGRSVANSVAARALGDHQTMHVSRYITPDTSVLGSFAHDAQNPSNNEVAFETRYDDQYTRAYSRLGFDYGQDARFRKMLVGLDTQNGLLNLGVDQQADYNSYHIQYNGSLVFVGNKVAMGPRIQNGFILVEKHESLEDATLYLSGFKRVDKGLAVLTGYQDNRAVDFSVIGADNLPPGYLLDTQTYQINPPLHLGHYLQMGTDSNISLILRLNSLDLSSLQGNKVFLKGITDPNFISQSVEIDFASRAYFSGISPGKYRLVFENERFESIKLDILKEGNALRQMGPITVKYLNH